MAQADSNKTNVLYAREATWGASVNVSTLNVYQTRITGTTMSHDKTTVLSEELRSDRMRADYMEVGVNAGGDFTFELIVDEMLPLFEGLAQSSAVLSSTTQAFTVTASVIAGADGWTNNLTVGQWIRVSTTQTVALNSQVYEIAALTSTTATITGGTLVASTITMNVTGKRIKNGTTEQSFVVVQEFENINQVVYFTGMEVSQMAMNVAYQAVVTGTFSFVGKQGFASAVASTPVSSVAASATTNTPMNATSNVGTIKEAGASLSTPLRAVNFTINNNLEPRLAIGNKPAIGIRSGTCDVSGTIEAYFEDLALLKKFINHNNTSLTFRFTNPGTTLGRMMIWTFPRIFFGAGSPTAPGINQDVILNLDFTAVRDSTTNCMFQIDII